MANNGNKRRSKLADMNVLPAQRSYSPTPVPPADQITYIIELDNENQLVVRLRTYRKKIVDFAVMHRTIDVEEWTEVARIDCCGGTVHRHLETREGVSLLDHDLIRDIPSGDGAWAVVEDGYEGALDEMEERWENNLRRWRVGK